MSVRCNISENKTCASFHSISILVMVASLWPQKLIITHFFGTWRGDVRRTCHFLHCDPFDHNLIFDFKCYCQHHWFCFWQSMTEFRRIPQLEYDTAFHFFDMKYESYCLEIWHYWDNTQYMLIKVYYYDKQIKSSKVETVSVINTSMCVYFCLLKMLLSL